MVAYSLASQLAMVYILRLNFKFHYFPGWVVGGWGEIKNKAKLSPARAGAWAELGNKMTKISNPFGLL